MGCRWQVWMEMVPELYISELAIETNLTAITVATAVAGVSPDLAVSSEFSIKVAVESAPGETVAVGITPVARAADADGDGNAIISLRIPHPQLWSPGSPFLYNLTVTLLKTVTRASNTEVVGDWKSTAVDEVQSCVNCCHLFSFIHPSKIITIGLKLSIVETECSRAVPIYVDYAHAGDIVASISDIVECAQWRWDKMALVRRHFFLTAKLSSCLVGSIKAGGRTGSTLPPQMMR